MGFAVVLIMVMIVIMIVTVMVVVMMPMPAMPKTPIGSPFGQTKNTAPLIGTIRLQK